MSSLEACVRPWLTVGGGQEMLLGRGLHSSTFQLNLSRFWHKIHPKHPLLPPDTY